MRIFIYYSEAAETNLYNKISVNVPLNLQSKIAKADNKNNEKATSTGMQFLSKIFNDNYQEKNFSEVRFMASGRPYVNFKNFDFNISHSKKWMVCAVANADVGIDIEKIKSVQIADFKKHFSSNEWININQSENPMKSFYYYWTIKESVLKADGAGLNANLSDVKIINGSHANFFGEDWFIKKVDICDGYVCHVASKNSVEEIIRKKINF